MRMDAGRIGGLALAAASLLLMGAGSTSRVVEFSPANAQAADVGPLDAYLQGQSGQGDVWLKLPSGEVVKGRFEVKLGGSVGALGKAYGVDARGAAYTGYGDTLLGGSPAVIDMSAPSGASIHCEVMNDNATSHGSGVCRFSNGAVYRVLY